MAAVGGLALGPLAFGLLHRYPATQLGIDGFVLVAIVGLVAIGVLPEAFESAGWFAVLAAAAGLLLPLGIEKVRALSHRASHGIVLTVALGALLLHASLDGVGIATAQDAPGLAAAIALHRLPVSLAVWWLVRPQFGTGWAVGVLGAIGVGTIAGYGLGAQLVQPGAWIHLVQAFVAGSLLHVLLHQSVGFHNHAPTDGWRISGAVGGVLGASVVLALPGVESSHFAQHLFAVAFIGAPVVVGLAVVASIVFALYDRARFKRDALRWLDHCVPWAIAAIVVVSLAAIPNIDVGWAGWPSLVALLGLVVLSLAHQGPRRFMLEVLPLELFRHEHDEDHEDHDHAPQVS